MSDVTEGLGSAVEGGLLARAVEPDTGAAPTRGPANCLNCGTPLQGAFCHACGQKAHIHRTISGIMHDLVHGVLHLDGKLWNTLPLLVFKPGRLTREYIEGKRVPRQPDAAALQSDRADAVSADPVIVRRGVAACQ